jgi:hypothetical protein
MMLFARRLENVLIQKRLHEANAAVAAAFPQRGGPTTRAVIEVAHELRCRNNVRCWEGP